MSPGSGTGSSGGGPSPTGSSSAGDASSGTGPAVDACAEPLEPADFDPPSFEFDDEHRELVAQLSGAMPLPTGETLPGRWTADDRTAARSELATRLRALGMQTDASMYSESGGNVVGFLPSTTGDDRIVILGAHFDSREDSPGAADNATGVAAVMTAARFATSLPCRRVGFVFAFFDEEELGLWGSEHLAAAAVASEWNVQSVHTIDMISWDQDGDRLLEIHLPAAGLLELYESAAARPGVGVEVRMFPFRRSDHASFRALGFPAVGLMEGWNSGDRTPHYHLPSDTFEQVDFDYLAAVTRLMLYVVADLALQ